MIPWLLTKRKWPTNLGHGAAEAAANYVNRISSASPTYVPGQTIRVAQGDRLRTATRLHGTLFHVAQEDAEASSVFPEWREQTSTSHGPTQGIRCLLRRRFVIFVDFVGSSKAARMAPHRSFRLGYEENLGSKHLRVTRKLRRGGYALVFEGAVGEADWGCCLVHRFGPTMLAERRRSFPITPALKSRLQRRAAIRNR